MDMQPDGEAQDPSLRQQEIRFPNGNKAWAVLSPIGTHVKDLMRCLSIPQPRAIIMIAGGAAQMEKQIMSALSASVSYGVVHVASSLGALIIDGGTQSGVMELTGLGVAQQEHRPLLLGVTPAGLVSYPGQSISKTCHQGTPLDPNHSHFVLVETDEWGGETDTMYELARAFSRNHPSLAVLVNGGDITRKEVLYCVRQKRPIIVLEGSGRVADEVAHALHDQSSLLADSELVEIIADGDLYPFPVTGSTVALKQLMHRLLDL